MNFDLTDDQQALHDLVVRVARARLAGDVAARDADGTFPWDEWKVCAELGIQGLAVDPAHGGGGADATTVIAAMEALGYACRDNGLIFSLNAQMWAVQHPIGRFGTEEQRRRWLPALCAGTAVGGHAMSEPGSGSDAFSLATTATPDGDGYVLDGSKTFVTNGPVADVFVVFATVDRGRGFAGLCAFLVERGTSGLTVGPPISKMGLRTSPMCELFLDGARVPASALLGKVGAGMAVFTSSMERERSLILASAVGTMRHELERSVAHARERRQFGQPIGKFQSVQNRLVDMRLRLETSRLLLYRLGWLLDHGRPAALDAALVKLHLSESFLQSSLDAVQVHGGYGYTTEYGLERDVRDAVGSRLYSGTSDLQRVVAARHMGL